MGNGSNVLVINNNEIVGNSMNDKIEVRIADKQFYREKCEKLEAENQKLRESRPDCDDCLIHEENAELKEQVDQLLKDDTDYTNEIKELKARWEKLKVNTASRIPACHHFLRIMKELEEKVKEA